jgi:hypothetical protein
MKPIILLFLTLPAAVPPGTLSYCQTQSPQPQAPFSIRISAPQSVIVAGSSAMVNVSLTNTSNQPITVFKGYDSFCGLEVHVHDAANKRSKMTEAQWNLSGKKAPADDHNDYHGYRNLLFLGGGGGRLWVSP